MSNPRTPSHTPRRIRRVVFVMTIVVAAVVPIAHGQVGSDAPAEAASSGFVETFDTPASLNRFDYGVHHAWIAESAKPGWYGDHDQNCGSADTTRLITNPTRVDDNKTYYPGMGRNVGVVYWCREHMMTSFNTNRYAQIDVSPKQVFEGVSRICWDQNRTDVGARMWTQVVIVPLDTFNANNGRFDYVARRLSKSGPGAFGIHPTDETFMMEVTDGGTYAQTGQSVDTDSSGNWVTNDKATRYQVCLRDNNNGTVRVELENNSGVQVRTVRGAIPNEPSRVIFQHDLYNPDKDSGVANGYTWHWDNIIIETDGWTAPSQPSTPPPPPSNSDEYRPSSPQRIFDSRATTPNVQSHATGARLAAGSVTAIPVAGRFGVAANAKAVVANVTATKATQSGYIVAGACGRKPGASTVNFTTSGAHANLATVPLDAQGRMCIWTTAPTHALVDISGFYPASSGFQSVAGLRYLDTRARANTFDGSGAVGRVGDGRQIEVQVAGRGSIPASAAAVAINLTAVAPSGSGHALAFPCGAQRPTASNLNYVAGQNIASGGIVGIGQDGKICLFVHEETHLLLDVSGWMPDSTFKRLVPARIADTRPGNATVDGKVAGVGVVPAGSTLRIPLNGRGAVPSTASAVAVHLTIASPAAGGFASAYPCNQPSPGTSTVNYRAGETVTNGAIIRAGGDICVRSSSTAHVIVDVEGYFPD